MDKENSSKLILEIDEINDEVWRINRDEPDKGIELSKKSLKLSKTAGYKLGVARAEHNMGMCYGWLSDFEKALELTEASLLVFQKLNSVNDIGQNHYSVGTIFYYKGDFKKAKNHYHESLKHYEKAKNDLGITNAYNGLGSVYTEIENYETANDFLVKGLNLSIKIGENKIRPKIYDGLAGISAKQLDYHRAKEYYEQGLEISIESNQKHQKSFFLEGIGECLINLEEYDTALSYLNESLDLRKDLGLKFGQATSLQNIGIAHLKKNKLKEAESYLLESLTLANQIDGKAIAMKIYHSLSILYELKKDTSKVVDNLRKYYDLKEELISEEQLKTQNYKLEQAYLNTKILSEIGQEIIASLELEKVLFTIYEKVNKLMDASVFGIGLYYPEEQYIEYKLAIDRGKKYEPYKRDTNDKNQLAVWCIDQKTPVFINDFDSEYVKYIPNYSLKIEQEINTMGGSWDVSLEQSIQYVPIMSGDDVLGVITVQSKEKNVYNNHHLDILRNISVYASIALINVRMYESLESQIKERTKEVTNQNEQLEKTYQNTKILNEIGQDITSSLSIKEVIQKVYKSINNIMDAAVFSIALYNSKSNTLVFEGGMENDEELPYYELELDDDNRLAVQCFNKKKAIIIGDIDRDLKKYVTISLPPRAGDQMQSVLYFPLISKDKTLGVFTVQSAQKDAYSAYHIDLLRNLAVYTPIALDNALMYGRMEKEKEKAEFEREEAKYQRRRAEQSERFKQQFLANMSHEIRTPMNAIMGMTNLLLEKNPPEQELPYLSGIKKSSESLLVIINDILDLSKIEAGKMVLEHTDFSLQEMLRLLEQTMSYRADEKGLILSVICDEQIPPVLIGDPVRLQQVLMNMMGNALKFTEKGGVTIRVDLDGGIVGDLCKLRFEIHDTGIGMSQEQQSKVFEDFSQASADTTRKYGGTGLGLSISSKLIELFGSTIKLESEPGVGSTFSFTITLPVSKNKQAVNKEGEIPADFLKELEGIRILLAEDNEYNQIVATETLELKIPGVKVTKANNGEEAFHMIRDKGENFDLVLMDVQMPVMDGFDATRNIRKLKTKNNKIPIVALTASVIKKDIQMCYDAGMIGFVPKPFRTSELIEAIYKAYKLKGNPAKVMDNQQEEVIEANGKITSMAFLQEFTEGDQERMNKYVNMYLDSAKQNVPKLEELLKEEKWDELKVLVHSMKPHFDFMGMHQTRELAENIEKILMDKSDMDLIHEKLAKMIKEMNQSISELNNTLI